MPCSNRLLQDYAPISRIGDCPVVLVVSHSGLQTPQAIPDRPNLLTAGESLLPDLHTDALAYGIETHMQQTGLRPYIVVGQVARIKVDFNNPPDRAYQGIGECLYLQFHNQIEEFVSRILAVFPFSLVVDIHGFSRNATHAARMYDAILGTKNGLTMPIHDTTGITRVEMTQRLVAAGWSVYPEANGLEEIFWGGHIISLYGRSLQTRAVQIEVSSRVRKRRRLLGRFSRDVGTTIVEMISRSVTSSSEWERKLS